MRTIAAGTTSQLSCFLPFSAINRHLHISRPPLLISTSTLRPNSLLSLAMNVESSSKTRICASYTGVASPVKADPPILDDEQVDPPKGAAKIHDFCFGIPFGGMVLSGGLLGFFFTRNLATLGSGIMFGGALLALSIFSLKIWRQGKSSLPFIVGQGVLAVILLWKNLQTYAVTKKVFPTGFYAAVSAAMICFYSYVLLSGGNPPPKKLKTSATAISS